MTTIVAPEPAISGAAGAATEPPPRRAARLAARAEGATKEFGAGATRVVALDHVDLEVPEGEFTAIMGPSGSGKSTLLYCMAGLERLTYGHVFVGDVDLTTLDDRRLTQLRRDRIGFVFQAYNLVPTLTAAENITLPLAIARRHPEQGWLDDVIDTVGLRDRLHHRPAELSGGQQQRVAAARALVTKPAIVFADEPSGNLDSRSGAQLLEFMRRSVRTYGQTIVMVTHDPIIATYADRVVFLKDGRIVDGMQAPTVDRVLSRMSSLEA